MDVEDPNSPNNPPPAQGVNWLGIIDGIPIFAKLVVCVLVTLYILGLVFPDFMLFWVALVPSNTIGNMIFWNILSGQLFHLRADLVGLIFSCVAVLGSGRLVKFWGETEYLFFSGVVALICGVTTYFYKYIGYFLFRELSFLFNPIGGFYGVATAYAVAFKQLEPEFELLFSIRAKHLPFIIVLIGGLTSALMFDSADGTLIFVGWIASWVYLRFFQKRDGVIGDHSDAFQFSSFFPEMLQPIVKLFVLIVSKCCFFLPQLKRSTPTPDFTNELPVSPILPPTSDAERRRQLGIKALDQKLGKVRIPVPEVQRTLDTK